jgi:hypothetical protein
MSPLGPLGVPRNDTLGMESSRATARGVIALRIALRIPEAIPEGTPRPIIRDLRRAAG